MAQSVSREVLKKLRKLAQLAADLRRGEHFEVTRLTILKSLCKEQTTANRFVTYLAGKTLERVEQGQGRSSHPGTPEDLTHRQLMAEALPEMQAWPEKPTDAQRHRLWELMRRIQAEQNEHKRVHSAPVRIIHDWDLLIFEKGLHCLLRPEYEAPFWVYETARDYAERYDSGRPSGLVRKSAPLVQDIVDFWAGFFDLDLSDADADAVAQAGADVSSPPAHPRSKSSSSRTGAGKKKQSPPAFTDRQGQFLAFIHLYRRLHRRGPAELDLVHYFRLTPPSVHNMIVKLEQLGLITREPGVARSARVAIPEDQIPKLEEVEWPPS